MAQTPERSPHQGNVADILGKHLKTLGLDKPSERDQVNQAVQDELASRGFEGEVTSLRYGIVEIQTDQATAALLRYDLEDLTCSIAFLSGGTVHEVRLRTRRQPRR
jgi:hypothetical protein